jgi:tetratricopeptide (TPR) repeat protein
LAAKEDPISFLKGLFGQRDRSKAPGPRQLSAALQAFVRCDTWAGSRAVLEAHPELLDEVIDPVWEKVLREAREQGETNLIPYLLVHRRILRRAREVGIDAAWAEVGCPTGAPKEAWLLSHPLYPLAREVLEGYLPLEQALREVAVPAVLVDLDDELLGRLDGHVRERLDDWPQVEQNRVLSELNLAAARALPASPGRRALCATTLGDALGRLTVTGPEQLKAIQDRRVERYRDALVLWEQQGETEQAGRTWGLLGGALFERFKALGQAADLEQAIAAFERVQALAPAEGQAGLGTALLRRFESSGRTADLDRAIAAFEQDLAQAPEQAHARVRLGLARLRRFALNGLMVDLEEARRALQEGLAGVAAGSADWARGSLALGQAHRARWEALREDADRDAAIQSYEDILASCPPDVFPEYVRAAALPLLPLLLSRQAEEDWPRAAAASAAASAAAVYLYLEELTSPAHSGPAPYAYHTALALSPLGPAPEEPGDLGAIQAYALARARCPAPAVEALEAGILRRMAEIVLPERAGERLPEQTWREAFAAAWRRVRKDAEEYDRADDPRCSWATARLAEARRDFYYLGQGLFPELFPVTSAAEIQSGAGDAALVYLAVTAAGGLALVVHAGQVTPAWFDCTEPDLRECLQRFRSGPAGEDWSTLPQALSLLGEKVLGPLAVALSRILGRAEGEPARPAGEREEGPAAPVRSVTLIPTGLLAHLPLHAAVFPFEGQEVVLADRFVVTYGLSAQTLASARRRRERRPDAPWRLAGLADPDSAVAATELAAVSSLFPPRMARLLPPADTDRGALLAALSEVTVAHLAGPARSDPHAPLDSAVFLAGGGRLTLRDLLRPAGGEAVSRLRLLVLSAGQMPLFACGDLPEAAALPLPAGLLRAGVPAVVTSFWPVGDTSRVLLLVRFYELLPEERMSPAVALWRAQRWLRDLTDAQLVQYLEGHGLQEPLAGETARARQSVQEGRGAERPYAAPHHWAAFACYGVV